MEPRNGEWRSFFMIATRKNNDLIDAGDCKKTTGWIPDLICETGTSFVTLEI
jgi:hypothetical protein